MRLQSFVSGADKPQPLPSYRSGACQNSPNTPSARLSQATQATRTLLGSYSQGRHSRLCMCSGLPRLLPHAAVGGFNSSATFFGRRAHAVSPELQPTHDAWICLLQVAQSGSVSYGSACALASTHLASHHAVLKLQLHGYTACRFRMQSNSLPFHPMFAG